MEVLLLPHVHSFFASKYQFKIWYNELIKYYLVSNINFSWLGILALTEFYFKAEWIQRSSSNFGERSALVSEASGQ
jgi:hypothetical protein